jgi:hypothetical protein
MCGNPYCNWAAPRRLLTGWHPNRWGPQAWGFLRDGRLLAVTAHTREEAREKLARDQDVHWYGVAPREPDEEFDVRVFGPPG